MNMTMKSHFIYNKTKYAGYYMPNPFVATLRKLPHYFGVVRHSNAPVTRLSIGKDYVGDYRRIIWRESPILEPFLEFALIFNPSLQEFLREFAQECYEAHLWSNLAKTGAVFWTPEQQERTALGVRPAVFYEPGGVRLTPLIRQQVRRKYGNKVVFINDL